MNLIQLCTIPFSTTTAKIQNSLNQSPIKPNSNPKTFFNEVLCFLNGSMKFSVADQKDSSPKSPSEIVPNPHCWILNYAWKQEASQPILLTF